MITLNSNAKINRSLLVYPPMENGYHPIQSVFQEISLADTLTVSDLDKGEFVLESSDPNVPVDDRNILTKVYEAFSDRLDCGFEIFLDKQIPMGAGLGGGSSNAAAFLNYLNDRFLNLSIEALAAEAVQFGADVPFFLNGGRAYVSGVGEIIEPLYPVAATEFYVLLYPNIHADTAKVYAAFDEYFDGVEKPLIDPETVCAERQGHNDLCEPAMSLYPEIKDVFDWGKDQESTPFMTGSGSTLYWVFASEEAAQVLSEQLTIAFPDSRLFLANSIN